MPTETKNSTAKASRSGSVPSAAWWLSSRFVEHHAGEERAERERHAEQLRRAEGDAERDGEHARGVNSSREPVCATSCSSHGITRRPTTSISATNAADLGEVMAMPQRGCQHRCG